MKIGDYVTVQDIMNQSDCRWVVLVDLDIVDDADIEGGVIKYIEDTKVKAGSKAAGLSRKGIQNTLVSGALEPISFGGVFVR